MLIKFQRNGNISVKVDSEESTISVEFQPGWKENLEKRNKKNNIRVYKYTDKDPESGKFQTMREMELKKTISSFRNTETRKAIGRIILMALLQDKYDLEKKIIKQAAKYNSLLK